MRYCRCLLGEHRCWSFAWANNLLLPNIRCGFCGYFPAFHKPLYPSHQVIRHDHLPASFHYLMPRKLSFFSCSVLWSDVSSCMHTRQTSRTRLLTASASRCVFDLPVHIQPLQNSVLPFNIHSLYLLSVILTYLHDITPNMREERKKTIT
jgi:hypothetical protein